MSDKKCKPLALFTDNRQLPTDNLKISLFFLCVLWYTIGKNIGFSQQVRLYHKGGAEMPIFKCKYCGGNVEQFPGGALGHCQSCGSKMTLPVSQDDRRAASHNTGNYFRRMGYFDKAMDEYQKLLQEDTRDAEAAWGCVLSRFGIQYEPAGSGTYRPICKLNPEGDFLKDGHYLAALANSEGAVRLLYEQEGARIAEAVMKKQDNPESLLKRAYLLLEAKQWPEADFAFSRCLALQPDNAMAWLGKLLAEQNCCRPKELADCTRAIDSSKYYQNTLRYADDRLKKTLQACAAQILKNHPPQETVEAYRKAIAAMEQASSQEQYTRAAAMFHRLKDFQDSEMKEKECLKRAEVAQKDALYLSGVSIASNAGSIAEYRRALTFFNKVPTWRDTPQRIAECEHSILLLEAASVMPKKKKKRVWPKIVGVTMVLLMAAGVGMYFWVTQYLIPEKQYMDAEALLIANNRPAAIAAFQELAPYKDAADRALQIQEDWYFDAEAMLQRMEFARAAAAFGGLGDFADARERSWNIWNSVAVRHTLAGGGWYSTALQTNGAALAAGDNRDGQCRVDEWSDIVSISAGWSHTVGLKADGTAVYAGYNGDGRADVSDWTDLVAISAGQWHTVGLKNNGEVIGTGCDNDGRLDFSLWKEIADVSAGRNHTVGLRADGTVVAVGDNSDGQCNVSDWRGITAIAAGGVHTVGLKADGTVVAVGSNEDRKCMVEDWKNIVAIAAGYYHTVGLKSDGTVVAIGWDRDGQCRVSKWTNIVAIAAGGWHTYGLKSDGTIVSTGRNAEEQCELTDWKYIAQ